MEEIGGFLVRRTIGGIGGIAAIHAARRQKCRALRRILRSADFGVMQNISGDADNNLVHRYIPSRRAKRLFGGMP